MRGNQPPSTGQRIANEITCQRSSFVRGATPATHILVIRTTKVDKALRAHTWNIYHHILGTFSRVSTSPIMEWKSGKMIMYFRHMISAFTRFVNYYALKKNKNEVVEKRQW